MVTSLPKIRGYLLPTSIAAFNYYVNCISLMPKFCLPLISLMPKLHVVPDWFWNLSSRIKYMNLSSNELEGSVPDFSSQLQLSQLDLSFNNFWSPLPYFFANLRILILARNSFFGSISHLCGILSINNSLLFGSIFK